MATRRARSEASLGGPRPSVTPNPIRQPSPDPPSPAGHPQPTDLAAMEARLRELARMELIESAADMAGPTMDRAARDRLVHDVVNQHFARERLKEDVLNDPLKLLARWWRMFLRGVEVPMQQSKTRLAYRAASTAATLVCLVVLLLAKVLLDSVTYLQSVSTRALCLLGALLYLVAVKLRPLVAWLESLIDELIERLTGWRPEPLVAPPRPPPAPPTCTPPASTDPSFLTSLEGLSPAAAASTAAAPTSETSWYSTVAGVLSSAPAEIARDAAVAVVARHLLGAGLAAALAAKAPALVLTAPVVAYIANRAA